VWLRWADCPKDPQGRLIAYCAHGSHAFYPAPGPWPRIFGFATDRVPSEAEGGKPFIPTDADMVDANAQPWSNSSNAFIEPGASRPSRLRL
jgi:hypothetical protein